MKPGFYFREFLPKYRKRFERYHEGDGALLHSVENQRPGPCRRGRIPRPANRYRYKRPVIGSSHGYAPYLR